MKEYHMLIQKLQADQLIARKAKDYVATGLLTALVSEAAMVGKNAGNRISTDDEVLATIRKFLKNAEETLNRVKQLAGAEKAVSNFTEEIQILNGYLPQQMSDDQLREAINTFKTENPNANMGLAMKFLKEKYNGLYDGKQASIIAKEVI